MSDDLFNSEDGPAFEMGDDRDLEKNFEPDAATIAFLDQEAAAFEEIKEQFSDMYGFTHDCHCDTDYSSGKVVEVTECFAGMIVDSLETCARLNTENKALKEMLTVMFRLNDELVEVNSGAVPSDTEAEVTEVEGADAPGLASDGTPLA